MKLHQLISTITLSILALALFGCVDKRNNIKKPIPVISAENLELMQIDSLGWSWDSQAFGAAKELTDADLLIETDTMRLHFFGWNTEEDSVFHVSFPENTDKFGRVVLRYRFTGWNVGPSDWDMTTQIMIWDNDNQQWLEFTRCITPYGGSFGKNMFRKQMWGKDAYLDITEFLPLLKGDAKFKIFYCGWDATDLRAHAVQLGFGFYSDTKYVGTQTCRLKIYDSTEDPGAFGHNGYRAWSYGVIGCSIEDSARLGYRKLLIPAGTKRAILRVCFTGHGQDAYYGCGTFPGRPGYQVRNCAEFDYNEYQIVLCGDTLSKKGVIWETNNDNYTQAGTFRYDRAGWGPGKPCNVQHWELTGLTGEECYITIDMNLDEYIGTTDDPKHDQVPCYYVEADLFGYNQ